jgi:hypothetical protein
MTLKNLTTRGRKFFVPNLILACIITCAVVVSANAQQGPVANSGSQQPIYGHARVAVHSAVVNVTDLASQSAKTSSIWKSGIAAPAPRKMPLRRSLPKGAVVTFPLTLAAPDASTLTASTASLASPPPVSSFLALLDDQTVIPPDTDGAVGPTDVMTALNSEIRFQKRDGSQIVTLPTADFWFSLGATSISDPHVVYDPYGKRWIFTMVSDFFTPTASILLAVSQTSDPTGVWNLYRVLVDEKGKTLADFPLLGFNENWITVSENAYDNATSFFVESRIFVFDKADVYANGAGHFTFFEDPTGFSMAPARTHDKELDTEYLVEDWGGSLQVGTQIVGALRVSSITGSVNAPVFHSGIAFAIGSPWSDVPPFLNSEPQKGAKGIDGGDARIPQVDYRNGSLWTSHTVWLPFDKPTHSAAQWWQVLPNGKVHQMSRVQDPSGVIQYAYPSIAVNARNDALLGYSRFSPTQYASADYSFREHSDALNTMRSNRVLKSGEAPYFKTYGASRNRWGDFSATVVDPVNDVDMWTIQEYAATPSNVFDPAVGLVKQDRWGTWWGRIGGVQ